MHVANIDFTNFYSEAFDSTSGVSSFVKCVKGLTSTTNKAKIVIHQAGRLVWLADRIEEYASGRPALQILFYTIAAEAVAKIVMDYRGESESKKHVKIFFEDICSDSSREILRHAFSTSLSCGFLGLKEAIDYLYKIRCDVAHEGKYFAYALREDIPMLTPTSDEFLIAHTTLQELRRIVLEGALLGAMKLLPPDSSCRQLLNI